MKHHLHEKRYYSKTDLNSSMKIYYDCFETNLYFLQKL